MDEPDALRAKRKAAETEEQISKKPLPTLPLVRAFTVFLKLTPTRSCQVCSKQFCLWDLALIIYIVFIIQMVLAI